MRGHITKRAPGSWSIVLDLGRDPATGKRRQKWVTIKGTKRIAEKKLAELVHQMDQGGFVQPTKLTTGSLLEQWLRDYAATHVRAKTLEAYHQRARHLIEGLGSIHLAELRPDHIHAYYSAKLVGGRRDGKGGGLSPGTLIKHHNLLSEALSHAVKWGLLVRNVAEAVDPPRPVRKEMRSLSWSEVHQLLEGCKGTPWHSIFHTLVWTGMRRSELLALRWKDLDLLLATGRVSRALHQLSDGTFIYEKPKSAKGRRTIALSPASCIELNAHRDRQQAEAELLGLEISEENLVFGHPDGSPRAPSTLTLAHRRLTKRVGFAGLRLHDLRHTHATLMMADGVNPKIVSERLGHASVVITLDIYSHVLPNLQEAAALKFDAGMSRVAALAP